MAAPNIAEELGNLETYVSALKNEVLPKHKRETASNWIVANEVEYMNGALMRLDSANTKSFDDYYHLQKDYIVKKWKWVASQNLHKKRLQDSLLSTK